MDSILSHRETNFLLVKIEKHGADALELRSFLLRRKILIRACNSFAEPAAISFVWQFNAEKTIVGDSRH